VTVYAAPLADIAFVLDRICHLGDLAEFEQFAHADPALVNDLLAEAGRFMADTIAPLNPTGDAQGCTRHPDGSVTTPDGFVAAYRAYVDAGWGAVPFDPTYGGGGFPWVVGIALQEILTSANMAFSMAPLLTQGAIDAISHHGDDALRNVYLPKMISGEWTGSMNLTEPDAGSDVGAVRTRAVRAEDGSYRISGTKIFISFGEHDLAENIVHLVLARTPDAAPGTRGISCFIVPKFLLNDDGSLGAHNDVTCVSIEHKTGIKGSPTCVLSFGEGAFGDEGGAVGYLLGEEQRGMATMFTMMNQARLSVGLQGLALAERAYQQALQYSHDRHQGRAPGAPAGESSSIVDHPDVRRMLLTMKATIEAMRRLVYANAAAIDRSLHAADPGERAAATEVAALLTPLSKGWGTDMGVELTGIAVQIHGGMGFVEETGVAQHWRDSRITTIYEGTNGIQAIDLVGRKLTMRGGAVVKEHLTEAGELAGRLVAASELSLAGGRLLSSVETAERCTDWLLARGADQPALLAGATPYLRVLATVVAGGLMARSGLAALEDLEAGRGDPDFLHAKVLATRFFCEQIVPQVDGLEAAVCGGGDALEFDTVLLAR